MNYIWFLLIALIFILPASSFSYIIILGIFFLIYIINKPQRKYHDIGILLILGMAFSFIINSFDTFEIESVLRAIILCFLFILFPYFNDNIRISIYTPIIIMLVILLSQMADIYAITPIQQIINSYYPDNEIVYGQSGVDFSLSMAGRYGGLYRNPNNCGRALLILFSMYTLLSKRFVYSSLKRRNIINGVAITIAFIGILSTGSRTSFIAISILVFCYLYKDIMNLSKNKRVITFTISGFLIIYSFSKILSTESRLTQTSFALTDRENMLGALFDMIFSNPLRLFFGFFYHEKLSFYGLGFEGGLDSDIGNLIYYYGIVNIVLLLRLIYLVARNDFKLFIYVIPVFLTMASNGLFTSVAASFQIMILLGIFNAISHTKHIE